MPTLLFIVNCQNLNKICKLYPLLCFNPLQLQLIFELSKKTFQFCHLCNSFNLGILDSFAAYILLAPSGQPASRHCLLFLSNSSLSPVRLGVDFVLPLSQQEQEQQEQEQQEPSTKYLSCY